jgi:hypothetical protein
MKIVLRESAKKNRTTGETVNNYWWVVFADNGNLLLTSETYNQKSTRTRVARNFSEKTGIVIGEE